MLSPSHLNNKNNLIKNFNKKQSRLDTNFKLLNAFDCLFARLFKKVSAVVLSSSIVTNLSIMKTKK